MLSITKKAALLTAVLVMIGASSANAQPFRGRFVHPFWGPYAYPYGVYPYGAYRVYPFGARREADVRVEVTPKQTEVFVDGFYAGVADDFDGVFKRLHTTPGGHAITLRLEGYRTVTENIYVSPDSTFKLRDTMQRLRSSDRP